MRLSAKVLACTKKCAVKMRETCVRENVCAGPVRAALCTRVRIIRRIWSSNGCTLHTCSRNTANSEIQRLHFAHVFEEYDEFGDPAAVPCTHVRRIRRIYSSNGSTLHTCSKNTANLELERQHFAHVCKEYHKFGIIFSSLSATHCHPSTRSGRKPREL